MGDNSEELRHIEGSSLGEEMNPDRFAHSPSEQPVKAGQGETAYWAFVPHFGLRMTFACTREYEVITEQVLKLRQLRSAAV